MSESFDQIFVKSRSILDNWITSCVRNRKISRNTIAVGLVVINHLLLNCPVLESDVLSQGGELKGARSGLGKVLEKFGVRGNFIREVTTRQAGPDARRLFEQFSWGGIFSTLTSEEREVICLDLAKNLSTIANDILNRNNLKLTLDHRQAPTTWIHIIVENAKSRSGGVVEQHLIGAKLERRFNSLKIPNYPAHAGDAQTSRDGDFAVSKRIYHVTASPGRGVIQKCADNIRSNKNPILLVPNDQISKAQAFAEEEGIIDELSIISIESFVAQNIIEIAIEEDKENFTVFQEIVDLYNKRLKEVETDLSLIIEI